jgi:hypothetical protein
VLGEGTQTLSFAGVCDYYQKDYDWVTVLSVTGEKGFSASERWSHGIGPIGCVCLWAFVGSYWEAGAFRSDVGPVGTR